jgi:hypothetical protein
MIIFGSIVLAEVHNVSVEEQWWQLVIFVQGHDNPILLCGDSRAHVMVFL